jgi:hypothetical protein
MNLTTVKILMLPLLVMGALYGIRNYTGEVVTLYTTDGVGQTHKTSVWVIDHGHELWIRSLDPTSPWLDRLISHPEVKLQRAGALTAYYATPSIDRRARVNALMAERYGWAEWFLSKIEGRDDAVPVYLDPLG